MIFKSKLFGIAVSFALAILSTTLLVIACGSDGGDGNGDPEIVGCNSVRYNGYTFGNLGCAPGIASFDVETNQNGNIGRFRITCSGGCISSVQILGGSNNLIVSP